MSPFTWYHLTTLTTTGWPYTAVTAMNECSCDTGRKTICKSLVQVKAIRFIDDVHVMPVRLWVLKCAGNFRPHLHLVLTCLIFFKGNQSQGRILLALMLTRLTCGSCESCHAVPSRVSWGDAVVCALLILPLQRRDSSVSFWPFYLSFTVHCHLPLSEIWPQYRDALADPITLRLLCVLFAVTPNIFR